VICHELGRTLQVWVGKVGSIKGKDSLRGSQRRMQVPYFIHPHRNNLPWISASKQMASLDACSAAHDAAPVGRGYHGGLLLP
jgi:hypothetical protein